MTPAAAATDDNEVSVLPADATLTPSMVVISNNTDWFNLPTSTLRTTRLYEVVEQFVLLYDASVGGRGIVEFTYRFVPLPS